jgi:trans-aconitate 2-methyltransferase
MKLEFDGEKYKRASEHQKSWGKKLIAELEFEGNERILDLGCGDGLLTAELAQSVPDGFVLGIDASAGMTETARNDHARANLRFELRDINDMDFESQFDLVFSNATPHWIKDHGRLLGNVFKCLKQGGTVRFQFAADGNCPTLIRVLKAVTSAEKYASYFAEFEWPWYMPTAQQYGKLLEEVPFTEKEIWCEDADKYFGSAEELTGWIDQPSIVPFLGPVADKDRQRFRDAVVEQMIEQTRQKDGTYFETFRRINVFAKK